MMYLKILEANDYMSVPQISVLQCPSVCISISLLRCHIKVGE